MDKKSEKIGYFNDKKKSNQIKISLFSCLSGTKDFTNIYKYCFYRDLYNQYMQYINKLYIKKKKNKLLKLIYKHNNQFIENLCS